MVDDLLDADVRRTKNLGSISLDRLKAFPEMKAYLAASKDFAAAKLASSEAKEKIKALLRKHSKSLKDVENLDFVVNNNTVVIFQTMKPGGRKRASEIDFA